MKIRPVGPKLFLADGRKDRRTERPTDGWTGKDMTKRQVVFLNFANAPFESTPYNKIFSSYLTENTAILLQRQIGECHWRNYRSIP